MPASNYDDKDQLSRAAKALNDNDVWQYALDEIAREYQQLWQMSEPVQQVQRENAYYMIKAVEKLRSQVKTFCNAGSLSKNVAQNNVKPTVSN